MHCLNIQDPAAKEKYSGAIEDKIPVMMWTPVWIEEEFGTSIELDNLLKMRFELKISSGKKIKTFKKAIFFSNTYFY